MKKLACILITLFVASAPLMADVPTDGLRLWYKLDETTGSVVHDSSGNGFDGTKAWDVQWDNGSAKFTVDYSGLIQPNDATAVFAPFTGTNVMSISLWAKDSGSGDGSQWLFKSNLQGTGSIYCEYGPYGGSWWHMGQGNNATKYGFGETGMQAWHNWTVVRDADTMTVYMDGVAYGTDMNANNTAAYTGITSFVIGGSSGSWYTFFGNMHDFMVYDTALTADDAAAIYAATPEPTTIALLGFGALALIRRKK
jgi:hypothetical protein